MELTYFTEKESDQKKLDDFIINAGGLADVCGTEFLQSFLWGKILAAEGEEILRLGVADSGRLLLVATLIKKPLGGGFSYWYVPRGPILNLSQPAAARDEALAFLVRFLRKIETRAIFLRWEPISTAFIPGEKIRPTKDIQPAQTLVLDLHQNPETLLEAMHQKTRYNIRLAEKKGVAVQEGRVEDLEDFWRLLRLTGERDAFNLHPRRHYQNLLEQGAGAIKLFFAAYQGRRIATALFSFWGNKVVYLHGASDNQARNLMAPYLLQWSVIKQAQAQGYHYYDFYGISAKKWPGVTRFKLGFGGQIVDYPGTQDLIFKPLAYKCYSVLRQARRLF